MSQQILQQPDTLPNTGKNTAFTIYPTHEHADIAIRELERFEKELFFREQGIPPRKPRGTSASYGGY